jgi:hypothetical protein
MAIHFLELIFYSTLYIPAFYFGLLVKTNKIFNFLLTVYVKCVLYLKNIYIYYIIVSN